MDRPSNYHQLDALLNTKMDVRNCVDFKEELPVLPFVKAIQDPRQSQVEIIGFYTGRKNRCKKLRGF